MTGQDAIKLNAKQQAAKAASRLARPCERFYYWITHGEIAAALLAMGLWTGAGAIFYCLDKSWLTDEAEQVSLSLSVSVSVCVCLCVCCTCRSPTHITLRSGRCGEQPGCTAIDALYFAVITSTTVGYGDESPSSPLVGHFPLSHSFAHGRLRRPRAQGRLLAVIYLPITTVFFCNLVGATLSRFALPTHTDSAVAAVSSVALTWALTCALVTGRGGGVEALRSKRGQRRAAGPKSVWGGARR